MTAVDEESITLERVAELDELFKERYAGAIEDQLTNGYSLQSLLGIDHETRELWEHPVRIETKRSPGTWFGLEGACVEFPAPILSRPHGEETT